MQRRTRIVHGLLALSVIALAGCQKKAEAPATPAAPPPPPPFRVTGLELGKSLTADHRVAAPATSFGVRDTIYVVVGSEGTSKGVVLRARWTYLDGKDTLVVSADSQTVAPTGPAWSEFHISKPTLWPKGKYTVAVVADTAFVGEKSFEVK